jgi:hypothetical protein
MLLRLKIKAKAKIRLVGATPVTALGTQYREGVGVIVQFGDRFRDKTAGGDVGIKKGDSSGCFSFRSVAARADATDCRVQTSTPSPLASQLFRTVFAGILFYFFIYFSKQTRK